ncbi:Lrp/AsnC family transcriptional regulator [Brevibacillus humidisoli]|uniref:Lrp/AsnC family transcriptional regulator n=1 Tax=Brevibacillus humidisoli TaxID=2895522 RepID=UPI001E425007|nr:Lrp/AsnC family transcriptional regulator [Brevibacillus humidisoli]UFJ39699.1 Lrp/AsnC family transcriptional regulator [Brevibacillus humidisoli]
MDEIDRKILMHLQQNARVSMTELGKAVGLTSPATAERVRKLEERGVITGYRATVTAEKLNKQLTAYLLFDIRSQNGFSTFCGQHPDVVECHRVAGPYSHLTKVVTCSARSLEQFIDEAEAYGRATTLLVLSSPIEQKCILPDITS